MQTEEDPPESVATCSGDPQRYHPDDRANDAETILEFIQGDFARLMPLYEFVAWHPGKNNYLGL